ncbi:MAG TPA: hypothetical protein VGH55_07465 [Chthoniobacterales bacterium]
MTNYPTHQQVSTDFSSYCLVQVEVMFLAVVAVWCLIGLLIWLECYGERKPRRHFAALFVTLLCGPCAWITSAWTVAHQRRVVIPGKVVVSEPWQMPGRN